MKIPILYIKENTEINDVALVYVISEADKKNLPLNHRIIFITKKQYKNIRKIDNFISADMNIPFKIIGSIYGCTVILVK